MKPITIVCGFGRCGSSLVMQMLVAGGMPAFQSSRYPAFETSQSMELPQHWRWMKKAGGHALKILDIHRHAPPERLSYRIIWVDRNPVEQAKSMAKFFSATVPQLPPFTQAQMFKLAQSFINDRPGAMRIISRLSADILLLRFENIINDPETAAAALAKFCPGLNRVAMIAQVRPRGPECLPYLLEIELMKEGGAQHV